jgi:hypothetical protein
MCLAGPSLLLPRSLDPPSWLHEPSESLPDPLSFGLVASEVYAQQASALAYSLHDMANFVRSEVQVAEVQVLQALVVLDKGVKVLSHLLAVLTAAGQVLQADVCQSLVLTEGLGHRDEAGA